MCRWQRRRRRWHCVGGGSSSSARARALLRHSSSDEHRFTSRPKAASAALSEEVPLSLRLRNGHLPVNDRGLCARHLRSRFSEWHVRGGYSIISISLSSGNLKLCAFVWSSSISAEFLKDFVVVAELPFRAVNREDPEATVREQRTGNAKVKVKATTSRRVPAASTHFRQHCRPDQSQSTVTRTANFQFTWVGYYVRMCICNVYAMLFNRRRCSIDAASSSLRRINSPKWARNYYDAGNRAGGTLASGPEW